MQRAELDSIARELYDATMAGMADKRTPVYANNVRLLSTCLGLGVAVLDALFTIARSQDTIARKARLDAGWKPGDDVTC